MIVYRLSCNYQLIIASEANFAESKENNSHRIHVEYVTSTNKKGVNQRLFTLLAN